jgi:hypothetical protein
MHTLLEQQLSFAASIFDGALPSALLKSNVGLAVYRNNWRESMRKALLTDYPVIAQLVGDKCFRGLANNYALRYPSSSGDLQDFGTHFIDFLMQQYGASPHAYLSDVAALERALVRSQLAANVDSLTIDALGVIEPAAYSDLRFAPHPSASLISSCYPVFDIWQAHQAQVVGDLDLARGPQAVLVHRTGFDVSVVHLQPSVHTFFRSILNSVPLGVAMELAMAREDEFNAPLAIARLFEWQLVTALIH